MGRKLVDWRKDTTILARLPKVEELHLMNLSNYRIADVLHIDERTVRRDLDRIRLLWRERVGDDIEQQKQRSVQFYRHLQSKALGEFSRVKDTSLNKSAYLNTAKGAEDSIVKVLGLGTENVAHSGKVIQTHKLDLSLLTAEELHLLDTLVSKVAEPAGDQG